MLKEELELVKIHARIIAKEEIAIAIKDLHAEMEVIIPDGEDEPEIDMDLDSQDSSDGDIKEGNSYE